MRKSQSAFVKITRLKKEKYIHTYMKSNAWKGEKRETKVSEKNGQLVKIYFKISQLFYDYINT